MEGMIAVLNEYRSLPDGEDIRCKTGQKAKDGGMPPLARLSYLNTKKCIDGRKIVAVRLLRRSAMRKAGNETVGPTARGERRPF
jgi:hypothetical protein